MCSNYRHFRQGRLVFASGVARSNKLRIWARSGIAINAIHLQNGGTRSSWYRFNFVNVTAAELVLGQA